MIKKTIKKVLVGIVGLMVGLVAVTIAEQPTQNYSIQIATSIYQGFDSNQPLVAVPCRVYKIIISNPGATQQLISLYDGATAIAKVDSDNVENVVLTFKEPLIFETSFGVRSGTQTASSYISIQYRNGIGAGAEQPYRTYTVDTDSSDDTAFTGKLEVGYIIISVQTAATITLTDGTTVRMEIYCPATSVTQISAYDAPIRFETSLKVKSSQAAETDSHVIFHYRLLN